MLLALDAPEVCAGDTVVLREVKLRLGRDDRVRLEGPNGSGKTTLLAALCARSTITPDRLLFLPQEIAPDAGAPLLEEVRGLEREVRGRVLSLMAALGTILPGCSPPGTRCRERPESCDWRSDLGAMPGRWCSTSRQTI